MAAPLLYIMTSYALNFCVITNLGPSYLTVRRIGRESAPGNRRKVRPLRGSGNIGPRSNRDLEGTDLRKNVQINLISIFFYNLKFLLTLAINSFPLVVAREVGHARVTSTSKTSLSV